MRTDRFERLMGQMPQFGNLEFAPLGPPPTSEIRRYLPEIKTFLMHTANHIERFGGDVHGATLYVTTLKETHRWEIHAPKFAFLRESLYDHAIQSAWEVIRHKGFFRITQTAASTIFSIELLRREFIHRLPAIQTENATRRHPTFKGSARAALSNDPPVSQNINGDEREP